MTSQLSVLLVDDTEAIRRLARYSLESDERFRVAGEASSGAEALRVARRTAPDIVLVDLGLDGNAGGLALITELVAVAPATCVVVLSGHSEEAYGEQTRAAGAAAFLTKGSDILALPDVLAAVVRNRAVVATRLSDPAA